MASSPTVKKAAEQINGAWNSPRIAELRTVVARWRKLPYSGAIILVIGTLVGTLFIMALDRAVGTFPNPGLVYLPLVALLAYHWNWRYAAIATILQLFCVYYFFIAPQNTLKPLSPESAIQLVTLAAVAGFVLAIVQLARFRRAMAEHAAERLTALNRIGTALVSELDETRLLHLIAETARDLTGAGFAAFTLRALNETGEPLGPSEGHLFHLAAIVGVSPEQEEVFRHMPLGGEGLLAPIFHHGIAVRVDDALTFIHHPGAAEGGKFRPSTEYRNTARQAAYEYA